MFSKHNQITAETFRLNKIAEPNYMLFIICDSQKLETTSNIYRHERSVIIYLYTGQLLCNKKEWNTKSNNGWTAK